MQQRMVYQQTIPAASIAVAPPRQKKVLKIVNPETHEVTNTDELAQSSGNEQHEGNLAIYFC